MSELFETALSGWTEQIDGELKRIINGTDYPAKFKEALEYAVFPGGKRLRPVLALHWHELFAPADEYALSYACGIELLHSYSLVHDDMPCMDNDDFRRGKLSVHKRYGEGMALLVGDALMDLAYRVLSAPLPSGKPGPFHALFASCGDGGLIAGQFGDLYGGLGTLDELLAMYDKKTGMLIRLSCLSGYALGNNLDLVRFTELINEYKTPDKNFLGECVSQNVPASFVAAKLFGEGFGRAFQIYDDVSEYVNGDKPSGTSVLEYIDLDEAKKLLNSELNKALNALDMLDLDTRFLRELTQKFVIV